MLMNDAVAHRRPSVRWSIVVISAAFVALAGVAWFLFDGTASRIFGLSNQPFACENDRQLSIGSSMATAGCTADRAATVGPLRAEEANESFSSIRQLCGTKLVPVTDEQGQLRCIAISP
jgi:hypothetical protein